MPVDLLPESGSGLLALFVLICAVLYVASLLLHPYRPCYVCQGKARHFGSVFPRAHRMCGRCSGKGRVLRPMARLFRSE